MKLTISLILMFISIWVVGELLILFSSREKRSLSTGTVLLYALTGIMFFIILEVMVLAIIGIYRLRWIHIGLGLIILCGSIILTVTNNRKIYTPKLPALILTYHPPVTLAVGIVSAAFLYFLFPTIFFWGARDYGLYIINGVHIAEKGSVSYERDLYLEELPDEISNSLRPYPAFYSSYERNLSQNKGDMHPQFLPMASSAFAFAYSIGGMPFLLRINGFLSILSMLWGYLFARRFFSRKTADIFILFMIICPAQLWNARITESEILSQLLFLMAVYFFAAGWQKEKSGALLIGTFLIGLGSFCRIDNYLLYFGVYGITCYAAIWHHSKVRQMAHCTILLAGIGALSLYYGFNWHYGYFSDLWEGGSLSLLIYGNIIAFSGTLIFLLLRKFLFRDKVLGNPFAALITDKKWLLIVGILAFMFILFAFFIHPWPEFNGRGLIEFSWYISPLIPFLAVLGFLFFCYSREVQKDRFENYIEPLLLFFIIGTVSVLLYTVRPSIFADHFWASRRWIPVNFPFLLLLGAHAISAFPKSAHPKIPLPIKYFVSALCFLYVFAYMFTNSRLILFTQSLENLPAQYEEIVQELPRDRLILTDNGFIASFLRFVYHRPVYLLQENTSQDFQNFDLDEPFYMLTSQTMEEGIPQWQDEKKIRGMNPEMGKQKYPQKMIEEGFSFMLYKFTGQNEVVNEVDILDQVVIQDPAIFQNSQITAQIPGIVFYGPSLTLGPGDYMVTAEFSGKGKGYLEVIGDEGMHLFSRFYFDGRDGLDMPFELEKTQNDIEVRMVLLEDGPIHCEKLTLKQIQ